MDLDRFANRWGLISGPPSSQKEALLGGGEKLPLAAGGAKGGGSSAAAAGRDRSRIAMATQSVLLLNPPPLIPGEGGMNSPELRWLIKLIAMDDWGSISKELF